MFSGAQFSKAAAPEASGSLVAPAFISKTEALTAMLHDRNETRIMLYDRKLDPQVFDHPFVQAALSSYLGTAKAGLEVFTDRQTLQNYARLPFNDFIELIQQRPNTILRPAHTALDIDLLWSSRGKLYISDPKDPESGQFFDEASALHQRVGGIFLTMARQSPGPAPLAWDSGRPQL